MGRLNREEAQEIAHHDTVFFERCRNWFGELFYSVMDVTGDTCEAFPFIWWDEFGERRAYEKAARLYNSLVPDSEVVPLF